MQKIVFSSGVQDYEKLSESWEDPELMLVKQKVEQLMKFKHMSYPACGTQEIVVLNELQGEQLESFKNLSETLRGWLSSPDTSRYKVARTVSLW